MQGWDKIRDARWKRIVDLKLMQGKPELSPRGVVPESLFEDETHPLPAWDSLTKRSADRLGTSYVHFCSDGGCDGREYRPGSG